MELNFQLSSVQKNVRQLSDKVLLWQMEFLSRHERAVTVLVLRHLREIECRRLFVELGYSSMYEYCLKHLKYSEGQTQRRLSSARLMTELPEIELQIQSGDLNVTNLSKFQSFARSEKSLGQELAKESKLELLEQIQNKPTRQVERELLELSHQPASLAEKFHHTSVVVSENGVHQQYTKFDALLDQESQELLQEFKNLYAHELGDPSDISVLSFLLKRAVQHKNKQKGLIAKPKNNASLPSSPKVGEALAARKKTQPKTEGVREIPPLRKALKSATKRLVWERARACCEHQDDRSQVQCRSKFALEIDHLRPVALGGTDELSNLQLLCRAHNSRRAVKTFGVFR